ncbi:MAG: helix-turn-helix transcriptional regulator [Betaproteobacteria bacterium]|nr:helix-turn-helix transcriptional regulator [Betaproteobacteria bacterium]
MRSKLRELEERLAQDSEVNALATSDDDLVRIGAMMRTLREARGLTQRDVQRLSGVNQAEISRIETGPGTRGTTISQLAKLAHAQHARVVMVLVDEAVVEKVGPDKIEIELNGQAALAKVIL